VTIEVMKPFVGIDVGGTRVKAGLVRSGSVDNTIVTTITPGDKTEEGMLVLLDASVEGVCVGAGIKATDIDGIGIGIPGALRHRDGVIVKSPNFRIWDEFQIADRLESRVKAPVTVDNDANVVTLGEARFGAGRGVGDFACLTLGSGVGGGIFLDGRIYRGADGMAGEIGHMVVEPEGFPCGCGGRGCLEQYAAANGLRNMVRRDRLFGDLTEAALNDPDLPRRLCDAALAGDPGCSSYFDEFGYRLAIAVGGLLNLLNIHTVVLSGGLAHAFDVFSPKMFEELPNRGYRTIVEAARVIPCDLYEEGGILGAAAMAQDAIAGRTHEKRL